VVRLRGEIANIDNIVSSLPRGERELFRRIFEVVVTRGWLKPPNSMKPWLEEHFGSADRTVEQQIVRVTNLVTLEEALFNRLRSSRPLEVNPAPPSLKIKADLFHEPLINTPEDVFGRVEGEHCITASNVAKYEGFHGVIVFNEPDPLRFSREQVIDYIDTGWRWAQKAHAAAPESRYFFFIWNCGERAGASLPHGHAQVMLGRHRHYAKVEHLRRAALSYRDKYGSSYFDDLYRVHFSLGCGFEKDGVRILAYLAPIKEKEIILMAQDLNRALKETLYEVLACFRDKMGVISFNLALFLPPIVEAQENWKGFPAMVRLVDRGDSKSTTSDIGAMELFASSVISSDPFKVARTVESTLAKSMD